MEIRDATPADAEAVRTVHYDSIVELGGQAYDQTQVEAWAAGCESADYTGAIQSDDGEFIVAEQEGDDQSIAVERGDGREPPVTEGGGAIVGFGSLTLSAPEEYEAAVDAEVTGVYVHPAVAREGVGTRLYAELERRAGEHGFESIGLWASRNAVPFYESHGYDRVCEHSHEFSSHESTGVTGVVVEMKKEL